jgi:hypothetical protein
MSIAPPSAGLTEGQAMSCLASASVLRWMSSGDPLSA